MRLLKGHHLHEEAQAALARLSSAAASSQEVLQLKASRAVAEDETADHVQARASALAQLQRWVGLLAEDLATPALPVRPDEQTYVARHPAVAQARSDVEAARAEAASTAAHRKPNWTWQASYGQRSGFSDMVSLGVTIPLPVAPGERQDRETAAKLALQEKAEAALEETIRMASGEYRMLSSEAQHLSQRMERYRAGVLTTAQQRVEAAMAGYRSNQVPLMTLFEARHAQVQAQRKLLALERDLAKVHAQLFFKTLTGGER